PCIGGTQPRPAGAGRFFWRNHAREARDADAGAGAARPPKWPRTRHECCSRRLGAEKAPAIGAKPRLAADGRDNRNAGAVPASHHGAAATLRKALSAAREAAFGRGAGLLPCAREQPTTAYV